MKKFIVIFLLLISMISLSAENKYFKAQYFNSKVTGKDWIGWKASNVYITIDEFTRHIEIYSTIKQSINYSTLKYTLYTGYSLCSGKGIDSSNQPINVKFQEFSSGLFYLIIEYSDLQYSYSLVEIDSN